MVVKIESILHYCSRYIPMYLLILTRHITYDEKLLKKRFRQYCKCTLVFHVNLSKYLSSNRLFDFRETT